MVDKRRTVSIDITATDKISDKLNGLASKFEKIGTNLAGFNQAVASLAGSVSAINIPSGFENFVSSLKSLDGIKFPNISKFAAGMERLSSVGDIKNLGPIATELDKLSKVKVPGVLQLALGLEKLSGSTINISTAASAIKGIIGPLDRMAQIKVPNILALSEGISTLSKTVISQATTNSLLQFVNALVSLNGIKIPNMSKLATGILEISNIQNIGQVSTNLKALVDALNLFKNVKVPAVYQLSLGFKALEKIDVAKITQNIQSLANAISALEKSGTLKNFATLSSDLRTLQNQLSQTAPQLQNIQNSLARTGRTAETAGKQVKGFGERLTNYIQYRVIADTIMGMQNAFAGALKVITEYDQSLKDLQAITGATGAEVSIMGDKILDVASKTKFSASEVAGGMVILGQAGLSASEAVNTIGAVSDLATGTLSDMAVTVDLVSTALNVFSIEANKSSMVADVFANAVNKSKLTMDKLKTAFNYVGPIAADAGVTFQESAASMMVLANAGQRASTIGTGLRLMFSNLVDPPKKLADAVEKAGISLQDLDPRVHGLQTVLKNLDLVVEDAGMAFDIFGKRGAAAVLALKDSSGGFQGMMDTVSDTGTAAKMAAIQVEGLGVIFKNLKDRIQVLGIALGEAGISDILRGIGKSGQFAVSGLTTFVNSAMGGFITKAAVFAVSASAMVVVLGKLAVAVKAVTTAYTLNLAASASMLGSGTLISARAVSIASSFTAIKLGVIGATKAIWAFVTASTLLSGIVTSLAFPVAVIVAQFVYAVKSINEFRKSSEEAIKAAAKFAELEGGMEAYSSKVRNLSSDSKELKDANVALRKELLEVARSNEEVSVSATVAANSIDAYTGEILDGGEALEFYNKQLGEFRFNELKNSYRDAVNDIGNQTSALNRHMNSAMGTMKIISTNVAENFAHVLDGNFEYSKDATTKAQKAAEELKKSFNFSKELKEGNKTFKEFAQYAADLESIGFNNLSNQGKDLVTTFRSLEERSSALLQYLVDTNRVSFNSTESQLMSLAQELEFTEEQADALLHKFNQIQEARDRFNNSSTSSFVKEFADGTGLASEHIDEFESKVVKATETQLESIRKIEKENAVLANSYKNIQKKYEEAAKTDEEGAAKQRVKDIAEWNEAVRESNRKALKDFEYTAAREVGIAKTALEKQLKDIDASAQEKKKSNEWVGEQKAKAEMEYDKKVEDAKKNLLGKKNQLLIDELDKNNRVYDRAYAERVNSLSVQEAAELKSHEEVEILKLKASLLRHREELKLHQEKLRLLQDPNTEVDEKEIEKTKTKVDNSYIKVQQAEADINLAFIKQRVKANKEAIKEREESEREARKRRKEANEAEMEQLRLDSRKRIDILEREKIEIQKLPVGTNRAEKELEINKQISDEKIDLKRQELEAIKAYEDSSAADRIKGEADVQAEITSSLKSGLNDQRAVARERLDMIGDTWRQSAESIKQYTDALTEAYELGLLSTKDYSDKMILASQDVLAGLQVGLEKALLDLRTNAEIMADIGADIPDRMADGLMEMFEGAMESAESAKEAVIAWGRTTLLWIAKIIAQQLILKAIQAGISSFGNGGAVGAANSGTSVVGGLGDTTVGAFSANLNYADGGRVPGFSPSPKADNIPAWLTANEFVQPVRSVKHYGAAFMESVRTLKFPKELTTGFSTSTFTNIPRSSRLAEGGMPAYGNETVVKTGDVNLKIANIIDKGMIEDFLKTSNGEKSIMNLIRRNSSSIKAIVTN